MTQPFLAARDFLLAHRTDYATAVRDFRWPQLSEFNWALDYFDAMAEGNAADALWIVEEDGSEQRYSFAQLAARCGRAPCRVRVPRAVRG
jgi:acetyl-CoA synthetase